MRWGIKTNKQNPPNKQTKHKPQKNNFSQLLSFWKQVFLSLGNYIKNFQINVHDGFIF